MRWVAWVFFGLSAALPFAAAEESFSQIFFAQAKACASYQETLPCREEILEILDQLEQTGVWVKRGGDELRLRVVPTQGILEHVLACALAMGEVVELKGIIHTPLPCTPLCTLPEGPISEGLLHPDIAQDPDKLLTVLSRARILREYLFQGGDLSITYAKGGLEKRKPVEREIFQAEVNRFPNLHPVELSCEEFDSAITGATYFLIDQEGTPWIFTMKAFQANTLVMEGDWGLWFGPVDQPEISKRLKQVSDYLKQHGGPVLD